MPGAQKNLPIRVGLISQQVGTNLPRISTLTHISGALSQRPRICVHSAAGNQAPQVSGGLVDFRTW